MNKKLYPWIPILGIVPTLTNPQEETGLDKDYVLLLSACFQGFSLLFFPAIAKLLI